MTDKNKVLVTDAMSLPAIVPDNSHIANVQALYNGLHGTGIFPVYKSINGQVIAGTGLNIIIKDFIGGVQDEVDGGIFVTYLSGKLKLDSSTVIKSVASVVGIKGYVIIAPLIEGGKKDHGKGIVSVVSVLPATGHILLAELNIPAQTTQVLDSMIDNSVKKYLFSNDVLNKANENLKLYVDEKVAQAEARVMGIITTLSTTLRDEIVAGDQIVLDTINAKLGTSADAPDIAGSTLWSRINFIQLEQIWQTSYSEALWISFNDFAEYIDSRVTYLEEQGTVSPELIAWIQSIEDAINEATDFINQVSSQISAIEGDIVDIFSRFIQLNNLPIISNLFITPASPVDDDNLVASYNYYDANGDIEAGREIRWYKNGILQTALNNMLVVPNSLTTINDEWYFTLKVFDGYSWSNLETSSIIKIKSPSVYEDNFDGYTLGVFNPIANGYVFTGWNADTLSKYAFNIISAMDLKCLDIGVIQVYGQINLHRPEINLANGEVSADINIPTLIPSRGFGLCFRVGTVNGVWADKYIIYCHCMSSSQIAMYVAKEFSTGGGTHYLVSGPAFTVTPGTHKLKAVFNGALIQGYWDGALKIQALDSAFTTGGVGFEVAFSSYRIDNLIAK